jgi:hypothetical protein
MSITSALSKRYLQLLFFLCLTVVTVGLLSTSYWAGLALLIGVGLALFLPFAARSVRDFARNKIRRRTLLIAIPLVVVLIIVVLGFLFPPIFFHAIPAEDQKITLESYTATIEPTNTKLQRFTLEENVRVRFGSEKEPRRVSSTHTLTPDKNRNGFSMREVRFLPMQDAEFTSSEDDTKYYITVDSDHYVSLTVTGNDASGPKLYEGSVCDNDCLLSQVQLLHFPAGAFSEADNERNFHRDDFGDSETMSWSPYDLGQSVAFSYVPPPYFHVPYIHALLTHSTASLLWARLS